MRVGAERQRMAARTPVPSGSKGPLTLAGTAKHRLPGACGSLHRILPMLLLVLSAAALRPGYSQAVRGRTRSPHGPLAIACENCHTSTSWKPIRPVPDFNHTETRFPLRGLHVSVDCRVCHTKRIFSDVGTKCADCHADIHKRQFGGKCDSCHTVRGWRVSMQSVKQHQNRFPLLGAHAAVDCSSCHKEAASGRYVGLSTECASCHLKDYLNNKVLDHQAAKLPLQCEECHKLDSWRGATFDHARFSGFALAGAHARLACENCHAGGHFAGTPANCYSCHAKDYAGTTDPNHVKAGFPHYCSPCHNSSSWVGASFDHGARTGFALTGAHARASCDRCHIAGRYAGTPQDCHSCHTKDYEATTNPDHRKANFPTGCSDCHSTERWQGAKFDHGLARFPLTGAHTTLACSACHKGGVFADTPTACVSCHLAAFTNTRNPNHAAAGFPQDCTLCHTAAQWKGAQFDHNTAAKFPLTGAHVSVNCSECHKKNSFRAPRTPASPAI